LKNNAIAPPYFLHTRRGINFKFIPRFGVDVNFDHNFGRDFKVQIEVFVAPYWPGIFDIKKASALAPLAFLFLSPGSRTIIINVNIERIGIGGYKPWRYTFGKVLSLSWTHDFQSSFAVRNAVGRLVRKLIQNTLVFIPGNPVKKQRSVSRLMPRCFQI
jgi:hypothetical protein